MRENNLTIEVKWVLSEKEIQEVIELDKYIPKSLRERKEIIKEDALSPISAYALLKADGKVVGHLHAEPSSQLLSFFKKEDPLFAAEEGKFYVDSLIIEPSFRGADIIKALVKNLVEELKKKTNRKKVRASSHILYENNLSEKITSMLKDKIILERDVKLPSYGNKMCKFVEFEF